MTVTLKIYDFLRIEPLPYRNIDNENYHHPNSPSPLHHEKNIYPTSYPEEIVHIWSGITSKARKKPVMTLTLEWPSAWPKHGMRIWWRTGVTGDDFWIGLVLILKQKFYPFGSMYGIFTYIYHKNQPNVGKYTIHGSYGYYEVSSTLFLMMYTVQLFLFIHFTRLVQKFTVFSWECRVSSRL